MSFTSCPDCPGINGFHWRGCPAARPRAKRRPWPSTLALLGCLLAASFLLDGCVIAPAPYGPAYGRPDGWYHPGIDQRYLPGADRRYWRG